MSSNTTSTAAAADLLGHAATRRGILRAIVPGLAAAAGIAGAVGIAGAAGAAGAAAAGANVPPGSSARRRRANRRDRRPVTLTPELRQSYDILDAQLTVYGTGFQPSGLIDLLVWPDLASSPIRVSVFANRRGAFRTVIRDLCPAIAYVDAYVGGSGVPIAQSTGDFGIYTCLIGV
ncbi:MAG: hypothetical protein ACKOWF_18765 [Chloroflexota bacterium]